MFSKHKSLTTNSVNLLSNVVHIEDKKKQKRSAINWPADAIYTRERPKNVSAENVVTKAKMEREREKKKKEKKLVFEPSTEITFNVCI